MEAGNRCDFVVCSVAVSLDLFRWPKFSCLVIYPAFRLNFFEVFQLSLYDYIQYTYAKCKLQVTIYLCTTIFKLKELQEHHSAYTHQEILCLRDPADCYALLAILILMAPTRAWYNPLNLRISQSSIQINL